MIELRAVTLGQGEFLLSGLTHTAPKGGLTLLLGPVGSGKTSVLETICGLQPAHGGQTVLEGVDATQMPPAQRGIGYLPQDVALFDHLSVNDNIAFGCWQRDWSWSETNTRVNDLLKQLELMEFRNRFPAQLSGGQKKIVGLARAVAAKPAIVCLDEPFVALDEITRQKIAAWIGGLVLPDVTILVVTHRPELLESYATFQWHLE